MTSKPQRVTRQEETTGERTIKESIRIAKKNKGRGHGMTAAPTTITG